MSDRAQKLEEAIINFLQNTNEQTLKTLYDLVDVCSACDRDLVREGPCSLCQDGEKEMWAESGYRNTRIDD